MTTPIVIEEKHKPVNSEINAVQDALYAISEGAYRVTIPLLKTADGIAYADANFAPYASTHYVSKEKVQGGYKFTITQR